MTTDPQVSVHRVADRILTGQLRVIEIKAACSWSSQPPLFMS